MGGLSHGRMGGELRLKARARAARAMMARPSHKRKEVDEEEGRSGEEKRSRLNEEGEEVGVPRRASRPLPVQMGDKAVDLLALHSRVGSMGGYGKVTEGKLWGSVAEGLGLGAECAPGLKLVFVKYLKSSAQGSMNGGRFLHDSGSELEAGSEDDDRQQLECRQSSTSEDWVRNPSGDVSEDWYEGCREETVSLQRDVLNGMLEWIKRVALCPGDPTAGGSGQDDHWVSQCQMLTAKVRSVMWRGEPRGGGDGSMQAKPMPSAFYDESVRPDAQALERLRVTRERLAQYGFEPLPGPRSYHHHDRNADGSYWGAGQRSGRQTVNYNEASFARQNPQRKRIPIGTDFQADEVRWVPRDHDEVGPSSSGDEEYDDDESRWYGAQVVPPPPEVGESSLLGSRVGRGRAPSCECQEPGSIQCVRGHIEEARERKKAELGAAWYEMGFHKMGECVAEQWTKEDERTFRLVARTHTVSKSGNFWNFLPAALPHKTRAELNSYYFNVFMLRRRALQNRFPESKIDSDDDEGELPGESDDSEYGSTDDEDEDEDDLSDGPDDGGSDGLQPPGVMAYPHALKTPMDSTRVPKYRPLPDFNFSPSVHEVDRAHALNIAVDLGGNHMADDSHVVVVWDDKHLESSGVLSQEWQEPHWDTREQGVVTSSRQLSPPPINMGKDVVADVVRQAPPPALGDLWSQSMEMAPKREKDRLISTTGMIYELFGDDVSD